LVRLIVGVHRRDKSITSPRHSLHKPGVFCGISKSLADFVNGLVEALIEVYERVRRPDLLPQLFSSDDLSGMLEQGANDLERLVLEFDLDTVLPQLTRAAVDFEYTELQPSRIRGGHQQDQSSTMVGALPVTNAGINVQKPPCFQFTTWE
jgi:hypothetical protein